MFPQEEFLLLTLFIIFGGFCELYPLQQLHNTNQKAAKSNQLIANIESSWQ